MRRLLTPWRAHIETAGPGDLLVLPFWLHTHKEGRASFSSSEASLLRNPKMSLSEAFCLHTAAIILFLSDLL